MIRFNDCEYIDGFFYAASNEDNGFYKFNSESCELLFRFEDEQNIRNLFMRTALAGDVIVFSPSSSDSIYLYDHVRGVMERVGFVDKGIKDCKFHDIVIYQNQIFFMPVKYPTVIQLDLSDHSIRYLGAATEELKIKTGDSMPSLAYGFVTGDHLVACRLYSDMFLRYDIENGNAEVLSLNYGKERIWGYYCWDGYEYVVSEKGVSVYLNKKELFCDKSERFKNGKYLFSPCRYGKKVFFFPFKDHCPSVPIVIDKSADETISIRYRDFEPEMTFHCIKQIGDKLITLRNHDYSLFEFDLEREEARVVFQGDGLKDVSYESGTSSLKEWIGMVLDNKVVT